MKSDVFAKEIWEIYDRNLRTLAKDLLEGLPDYFYTVPASSSGKYHPQYALGEGGLVRHVKAAIKIALSLLELEQYKDLNRDYVIIALLLHDGLKQGNSEGNTVKEHPWLAANYVRNFDYPNKVQLGEIASLIESHMGQWNYGILPKPQSDAQKFIHLCDYLASRKFLEVNLDV